MTRPISEYHCTNLLFKKIEDFMEAIKRLGIWNALPPAHKAMMRSDYGERRLQDMNEVLDWWLALSTPRHCREITDKFNDFVELRQDINEYYRRVELGYHAQHIFDKIGTW